MRTNKKHQKRWKACSQARHPVSVADHKIELAEARIEKHQKLLEETRDAIALEAGKAAEPGFDHAAFAKLVAAPAKHARAVARFEERLEVVKAERTKAIKAFIRRVEQLRDAYAEEVA